VKAATLKSVLPQWWGVRARAREAALDDPKNIVNFL